MLLDYDTSNPSWTFNTASQAPPIMLHLEKVTPRQRSLANDADMPPEIRLKIYHYLFVKGHIDAYGRYPWGDPIPVYLSSQLLQTCSKIKNEGLPILLGKNEFRIFLYRGSIERLQQMVALTSHRLFQHLASDTIWDYDDCLLWRKDMAQLKMFSNLKTFKVKIFHMSLPGTVEGMRTFVKQQHSTENIVHSVLFDHPNAVEVTTVVRGRYHPPNQVWGLDNEHLKCFEFEIKRAKSSDATAEPNIMRIFHGPPYISHDPHQTRKEIHIEKYDTLAASLRPDMSLEIFHSEGTVPDHIADCYIAQ